MPRWCYGEQQRVNGRNGRRGTEQTKGTAASQRRPRSAKNNGHDETGARERSLLDTRDALAAWCEERSDIGDWPEAVRRWRKFRERYPTDVWGFAREAIALVN